MNVLSLTKSYSNLTTLSGLSMLPYGLTLRDVWIGSIFFAVIPPLFMSVELTGC